MSTVTDLLSQTPTRRQLRAALGCVALLHVAAFLACYYVPLPPSENVDLAKSGTVVLASASGAATCRYVSMCEVLDAAVRTGADVNIRFSVDGRGFWEYRVVGGVRTGSSSACEFLVDWGWRSFKVTVDVVRPGRVPGQARIETAKPGGYRQDLAIEAYVFVYPVLACLLVYYIVGARRLERDGRRGRKREVPHGGLGP
jgi:hypothetical protein